MTDREELKEIADNFPKDAEWLIFTAETADDETVKARLYEAEEKITKEIIE